MTNEEFIQSIALPGEEWRDVVEYEDLYSVSSFGRILCKEKEGRQARLMSPFRSNKHRKQSYLHVKLCKNNRYRHYTVHRLVARAFIPNPENYPCIDHIDGNGENNVFKNLRWCTRSMNNRNPISIERQSLSHKGKVMNSIRRKVVQLKDGNIVKIYDSLSCAEKDGFRHSCVSRACSKQLSKYKGFEWNLLSDYESQVSMSKNSEPIS